MRKQNIDVIKEVSTTSREIFDVFNKVSMYSDLIKIYMGIVVEKKNIPFFIRDNRS